MKWATRAGVHIDRAACAWLIRRDIDPGAEFVFISDPDEVPRDATPFDMRGAELGHHGDDCSFETMLPGTTSPTRPCGPSPASSAKPTSMTAATTHPKPPASTSSCAGCP
jgi:hypothetical protein